MPTLLLPNSKPLTAPHWRASADVYATNSTGSVKTSVFQCLVDTGSDYTILPNHVAATIGINLATDPTIVMKSFRTAIGATYALPYHP